MIRALTLSAILLLPACMAGPAGTNRPQQRAPGQGQYVRPAYLNPAPTLRLPPVDACQSQLYMGLVGRHEGSIYIAGLPSPKRILKPAFRESFEYAPDDTFGEAPLLYEVQDYVPDQVLYAPSILTVSELLQLGETQDDRLTIELDAGGYVQQVRCA